jgi:hypothetical protein
VEEEELGAVIAAARGSMPVDATHVEVRLSTEGDSAYVLLAAEVVGVGYYLDAHGAPPRPAAALARRGHADAADRQNPR